MAEPAGQRQLLAILFTDVVGYTALTERDEAAAVRVRDRHRERVREQVAAHGGELVDAPGDETLSVFPSALAAVDCTLALQAALREDAELRLRIGIHLGDVLRRGGEVIGEGVNVAARIRPLAEPGRARARRRGGRGRARARELRSLRGLLGRLHQRGLRGTSARTPRRLARLIPGAHFELIEGAGHVDACANDMRVMRLVSAFLAEPAP